MITFAVHDARAEAISAAVTPGATSAIRAGGYPACPDIHPRHVAPGD